MGAVTLHHFYVEVNPWFRENDFKAVLSENSNMSVLKRLRGNNSSAVHPAVFGV